MLLSIVVPVFREEKNIPEFLRRIRPILGEITQDYEIIFSMDPSPDRTEEVVLAERAQDDRIKLLKFSRRFGQPMATLAGMEYSRGDAVIVMDVDLQDPPELIHEMIKKWREGYDVVLPQRRARTGEPWLKKLVASSGYKVINKIADVKIPPNTGDFRLMTRRVILEVVKLKESHGFLRGMVAVVGFKQCLIPFDRPARFAGETIFLGRATGRPGESPFVKIRPEDIDAGGMETVFPWREADGDGTTVESHERMTKIGMGVRNPVMLIRIKPIDMPRVVKRQGQESFNFGELFAYTKVCSHLGCPASLYEQQTYRILCPCHQSQFDALHFARPTFGPAARALAQLPITIDKDGYLVANGDFIEPVGPAFWERRS
jgi:glycosyltransferase involved in cell wall biosynthesis/nitrite reductase/ring-hydroxylating ferredoxin subunit